MCCWELSRAYGVLAGEFTLFRLSEVLLHVPLEDPYWKMYSIVIQWARFWFCRFIFRHHIAKADFDVSEGESGICRYLDASVSLVMIAFVVRRSVVSAEKVIGKNLENVT